MALPVNLLLIGSQGSGKGTQAARLADRHRYHVIGTGDILRSHVKAGDALGKVVKRLMERGELINDALMETIIREELAALIPERPVIFDGFPRTVPQAKLLERIFITEERPLPYALYLKVQRATVIRRLANRRVCPDCGRVFSLPGLLKRFTCPRCWVAPMVRHDDQPEVIEQRLNLFFSQTLAVLDYYRQLGRYLEIDGEGTVEEVTNLIEHALNLPVTTRERESTRG